MSNGPLKKCNLIPTAVSKTSNVLGQALQPCSFEPLTGFFRDGCCHTGPGDHGLHTVCTVMTADFLRFSRAAGNDLSTPVPEYGFPGLKPGDRWCLCVTRWAEAVELVRHMHKEDRIAHTQDVCSTWWRDYKSRLEARVADFIGDVLT